MAILKHAAGDPGVTEAIDCIQGVTNDFSRFQEIFIKYGVHWYIAKFLAGGETKD